MINMIALKCPDCGANISIENGRKKCFCQYCGAQIMLDDGSITYRTVDEARIKEAEADEAVRMRALELEARAQESAERTKRVKLKGTIILAIIGIVMILVGLIGEAIAGDPNAPIGIFKTFGAFPFFAMLFMWL